MASAHFTEDDRVKIEEALDINSLAQELAITAVTGIYTHGVQDQAIINRRFEIINEIQEEFSEQKPALISAQYLKGLAESNFTLSEGFSFYMEEDKKSFTIVDEYGKEVTHLMQDILTSSGDKCFSSLEDFNSFAKKLIAKSPEAQYEEYSKHLTRTKQNNVKYANKSLANTPENKLAILQEIAKRNFSLPPGFTIEHSSVF